MNLSDSTFEAFTAQYCLHSQEISSINKNDELLITSEKSRSQHVNLEDALVKMRKMLRLAAFVPKETSESTKQRIVEYKRRDNERRIERKKIHSAKKIDRKYVE